MRRKLLVNNGKDHCRKHAKSLVIILSFLVKLRFLCLLQMVRHRIIQCSITGLINDADSEALLINMLDAVSALRIEEVDLTSWDETIAHMELTLIQFECSYPELIVSNKVTAFH